MSTPQNPTAILLLEDEPDIQAILYRLITSALYDAVGHNAPPVVTAFSAPQAHKLAEQRRLLLALIDHNLPGGESGLVFARWLRQQQPETRIVMTTAYDTPALRASAQAVVDDYLPKPFDLDRIDQLVRLILRTP